LDATNINAAHKTVSFRMGTNYGGHHAYITGKEGCREEFAKQLDELLSLSTVVSF
jgi:hypothetical protein